MTAPDLYGLWRAEFSSPARPAQGPLPGATLLLERHPDYDGLRGRITRDGLQAVMAGDVDDAQLTLEESADGTHISGSWVGRAVEGRCADELRGVFTRESDNLEWNFVLRRVGP